MICLFGFLIFEFVFYWLSRCNAEGLTPTCSELKWLMRQPYLFGGTETQAEYCTKGLKFRIQTCKGMFPV